IVIAPQCPPDQTWFDYRNELILLLDHVLEQHNVDPDRVYLTGLSMGGFGTWDLARLHPDRFAAIAPICGGLPWLVALGSAALTLRTMPVWAFHGALDDIVPIERSQEAVDALRAAGNDVRFTVYPDLKHDSWTISYANPELYTWFLEHRIERA
ncbi:MAG: prolyl oligopeptidase family serine peptidase, partial [Chloroflexota bacterium]